MKIEMEIVHWFRNKQEYATELRMNGMSLCKFSRSEDPWNNYYNEKNTYIEQAKHTNIFIDEK